MAKTVAIAYILWFFFGFFGLHQFYLGRDRHAFFIWATIGGICGIGFLRDLFYIPTYAAAADQTKEYLEELNLKMRMKPQPSVSTARFLSAMFLGWIFGLIFYLVFWTEKINPQLENLIFICSHLLAAFGVYFIYDEGEQTISIGWCLLGSFIALPLSMYYGYENIFYGALVSSVISLYGVQWKRTPRDKSCCKRLFILVCLGTFYLALISGAIYFNGTITTKDGETVPIREAAKNFFKSPAWKETKEMMKQFYQFYQHHGWKKLWDELIEALDPQGESNAYQVLGLNKSATQEDIKKAYKQLARRWHPDKVKDPEERNIAQEKFMEIQTAYDVLSSIKKSRSNKNDKTAA